MLRYAITSRHLLAADEHARRLAGSAVDFLLIREKDLYAAELLALCRAVRKAAPRLKLLVASRPDIALVAGLDGVHLTADPDDLTPTQVRTLFAESGRPAPMISVSCHTLVDIARQSPEHPSLILFAPVFAKLLPDGGELPGTGLDLLAQACRQAHPIPVLALGGITEESSHSCLQAGAAGIAGIRLFL